MRATRTLDGETTRERESKSAIRRLLLGRSYRRIGGFLFFAWHHREMFTATPAARAPFAGQVRPPLPTPMADEDSVTGSRTTAACVSGGRASGGGGRRPFPRAPQGALNSKGLAAAEDAGGAKPTRKAQRGLPLVQWVWPANSGSAIARAGSEWFRGATGGAGREQVSQENPMRLQGRTQKSSVVVGTVCEPVRPTRLDLSAAQGELELGVELTIAGSG